MLPQHKRSEAHQPELDGVRGLAILGVLLMHLSVPIHRLLPYGWVTSVTESGWAGVDLFFVLSGFLITRILLDTRGSGRFFRNFYARRALRILPVYVLIVGGFFFVALPLAHAHGKILHIKLSEQIWYWLFVENWRTGLGYNEGAEISHLWSVAVEEQFYLFWSLLVFWFGGRRFIRTATVLLFVFVTLRMVLWRLGATDVALYQITFLRMDGLIVGALLAASSQLRTVAAKLAPVVLPVGLALLLVLPWQPVLFFTNAIAFGTLVARASRSGFSLLRWNLLRSFGKYSYAIYMFNFLLIELLLMLEIRHNSVAFAVLVISLGPGLSYGLAWISWTVLEHPLLRLKRYFPNEKITES